MRCSEAELMDALAAHGKARGNLPGMTNDDLAQNYPGLYQSLLQLVHNTGERINGLMAGREAKSDKKR